VSARRGIRPRALLISTPCAGGDLYETKRIGYALATYDGRRKEFRGDPRPAARALAFEAANYRACGSKDGFYSPRNVHDGRKLKDLTDVFAVEDRPATNTLGIPPAYFGDDRRAADRGLKKLFAILQAPRPMRRKLATPVQGRGRPRPQRLARHRALDTQTATRPAESA